jgi:hypothetical protein
MNIIMFPVIPHDTGYQLLKNSTLCSYTQLLAFTFHSAQNILMRKAFENLPAREKMKSENRGMSYNDVIITKISAN